MDGSKAKKKPASKNPQKERLPNDWTQKFSEITPDIPPWLDGSVRGYFFAFLGHKNNVGRRLAPALHYFQTGMTITDCHAPSVLPMTNWIESFPKKPKHSSVLIQKELGDSKGERVSSGSSSLPLWPVLSCLSCRNKKDTRRRQLWMAHVRRDQGPALHCLSRSVKEQIATHLRCSQWHNNLKDDK